MREPNTRGWPMQRRRLIALLPGLLAVALVAAAFGIAAGRSLALEAQTRPPKWVVEAFPAAISELYYGHTKRYTILTTVRDRYYDALPGPTRMPSGTEVRLTMMPAAKDINLALRKAREINPSRVGTGYVLMGPDDKGIVDLIELSFLTFGYAAENVTTMYFVLLAASCLLYAAAFWRSPSRLLLVAAFLAMLYLAMPMVLYHGQLGSLLALRALPALAMVATLHCLVFLVGSLRERVSAWQIALAALQVCLVTFTVHLRASALWEVITIVGFGLAVLIAARFRLFGARTASWRSTGLAVGVTVGLTIAGYLGIRAYQTFGLPEEYRRGEEIATRVFWHNIFSGLAFHPQFSERYQLRIDDSSIFAATRDYLAETGQYDRWQDMGGEVPSFLGLNFTKYEPAAREMLFARCTTYVRECAEAVLYYKPVALAGNLAWLYGLRHLPPDLDIVVNRQLGEISGEVKHQTIEATDLMDQRGQRAYLWTPIVLLVLLPFALLLTGESRQSIRAAFAALVGLTAGSMLPTVIGYPLAHTMLEAALTVGMVGYFVLCLVVAAWLPALRARGLPRRRAAETTSPVPTAAR